MATALSKAGAAVAITSRHLSEAESVAADISEQTGGRVLALQADAGQLEQVEDSVVHTVDTLGQLDILVNNAGINIRSPIVELSDSDWEAVIATNPHGAYAVYCRAAGRHMVERGYGRIINLGSTLSHISIVDRTPYASSKGGIVQLTLRCLRMAESGITVNAICPGPFATPINQILLQDPVKAKEMQSKVPMGRWGDPAELATTVLYFASKASSFTTGSVLFVDGGYTSQ